jgi:WD40 repeat protein
MPLRLLAVLAFATALGCAPRSTLPRIAAPRWDVVSPMDTFLLTAARSADERRLALVDQNGTVVVWQLLPRRRLAEFDIPGPQPLHAASGAQAVLLDDSGDLFVAGGDDGRLRVWSVDPPRQLWSATPTPPGTIRALPQGGKLHHAGRRPVTAIAISPDATTLATGEGAMILLWDVATGQRRDSLWVVRGDSANSRVRRLLFAPAGGALLAATDDGWLHSYDPRTLRLAWRVDTGLEQPRLLITDSGAWLTAIAGSWTPTVIKIFRAGSPPREVCRFNVPFFTGTAAFSPTARHVVVGDGHSAVRVIAMDTCAEVGTYQGFAGTVTAAWFGPHCGSVIVALNISAALHHREIPSPGPKGC